MNYLDVDTFRDLLRTDLWDWKHLLSDRILFDYCNYLCIRESAEIQRYCNALHSLSRSEDSLDSLQLPYSSDFEFDSFYSTLSSDFEGEEEEEFDDGASVDRVFGGLEQNYAILKIQSDRVIDGHFILSQFESLDIINDRFSLTKNRDIGLHSNLCKELTIHSDDDMDTINPPSCTLKRSRNDQDRLHHHHLISKTSVRSNQEEDPNRSIKSDLKNMVPRDTEHGDNTVFSCTSFTELAQRVRDDGYYTDSDLVYIENLLMTDLLSIGIDEWHFAEWRTNGQLEDLNEFELVETKQMIIGHFDAATYKKKDADSHYFIVWSIERNQLVGMMDKSC